MRGVPDQPIPQVANDHSTSIQATTKSVHAETVRVVDEQMKDLDVQMTALDDFVTRARSENADHHDQHSVSMATLAGTVGASFSNISSHYKETFSRVQDLGDDMETNVQQLQGSLEPLDDDLAQPLSKLRDDIVSTGIRDYEPTGETPEKTEYQYPTRLPRTAPHDRLIAGLHGAPTPSKLTVTPARRTPAPQVFADPDDLEGAKSPSRPVSSDSSRGPLSESLREVNTMNLTTNTLLLDASASTMSLLPPTDENTAPIVKKSTSRIPYKQSNKKMRLEGVENLPPSELSQSSQRRKSPRLHEPVS